MEKCFICGTDEGESFLFEVIAKDGIQKICRNCLKENDFPVIKKADLPKNDAKRETSETYKKENAFGNSGNYAMTSFTDSSNKGNYDIKITLDSLSVNDPNAYNDVVGHFHWILMRKRRLKKLNKKQFAEAVKEPVQIIEMLEKGILPSGYINILGKIEKFLGVALLKDDARKKIVEKPQTLDFEKRNFNNLTIADLKRMKEEKESMRGDILAKGNSDKISLKESNAGESPKTRETLSEEEIDEILFG